MNEWFECKVSYKIEDASGKICKMTDHYLVDAISFMDAETRINEEVVSYINGEYKIDAVKREKVSEIIPCDIEEAKWFKIKVEFITIDDKSGKEKKTGTIMFLQSANIDNVIPSLREYMKGTMCDYTIVGLTSTKIIGVLKNEN